MSTIQDQRNEYENNPYFTGHIYGDFSPFYVTIAVCTILFISIVLLNVVLGCCSRHRKYWQDKHTGNRWLVSLWSATPHLQPPLDLTELKDVTYFQQFHPNFQQAPQVEQVFNDDIEAQEPIRPPRQQQQQQEQQQPLQHQRHIRPEGRGHIRQQREREREQFVELQKRESDI